MIIMRGLVILALLVDLPFLSIQLPTCIQELAHCLLHTIEVSIPQVMYSYV